MIVELKRVNFTFNTVNNQIDINDIFPETNNANKNDESVKTSLFTLPVELNIENHNNAILNMIGTNQCDLQNTNDHMNLISDLM
jgi:hypothetical protein